MAGRGVKIRLVLTFALLASPACADWIPDRIIGTIGSYHVGAEPGQFEEFNPGVIVEWNIANRLRAGGGALLNSFGEVSPIIEISGDFICTEVGQSLCFSGLVGVVAYGDKLYPAGNLNINWGPVWVGYSHAFGTFEDTSGVFQYGIKYDF